MAGRARGLVFVGARLLTALALLTGVLAIGAETASAGPAPISVQMTAPSTANIGQDLTYTIVVTNTGGAKVTEVVLTDTLNGLSGYDQGNGQDNMLALTSDVGSCGQTGNTVRCEAGVLEGRQTWTITIRGVVNGSTGTTLNNTASATATKSATTFTVSDTVSTQVLGGGGGGNPQPDLNVTIKAPTTTPPSNDLVYTLTVNNLGGVKASDIVLTASLDPDLTYLTYTATNLFVCTPGTDPDTMQPLLTCTGGAINAGASATVQIGVISPDAPDDIVTVSAAVDPYDTILETNELNNAAQATTQVGFVPSAQTLRLEKTDTPDPIAPGETLEYTIVLENTTPDRADYIEVVDGTQGLDASSVQVSWVYSGNMQSNPVPLDCVVAAPKVTCSTTRFQPGQVATITLRGTVIAPAGTSIINTATVNGNTRNTGLTNTASTITTVKAAIDLSVTQHRDVPVLPDAVRGGDQFEYLITVGNSGLYDATNVLVRQPLPKGADSTTTKDDVVLDLSKGVGPGYDSSAPGTTCSVDPNNVLTCVIPTVPGESNSQPGGATETIRLFLIAPHVIGPISSTVTVDPANAIAEHDEANNTFATVTDVLTGIDLTVSKTGTPDPVARNGTLKYTLTITNLGTQDTAGVVVRDVLPAGTVFRSASDVPSANGGPGGGSANELHNFTCSASGNAVECVGGRLEGTYSGHLLEGVDTATIEIDVFAPDEPGVYHNEVRVDPYGSIPEKDETNNLFLLNTTVINVNNPDPTVAGQYKELYIDDIVETSPDTPVPPNKPYATSGLLDYDITVVSNGVAPIAATDNAVVRITLPAGSIFRDAYDLAVVPPPGDPAGAFTCAHLGGRIVECSGGAFPGQGTRGIRVETFAPPTPGSAHLQAMVDPRNEILESDETNNVNDEFTQIAAGEVSEVQRTYIDLKPGITGMSEVATNGTLDYAITITNPGAADAFGVAFQAILPQGSVFRTADDAAPADVAAAFSCTQAAQVVTCSGGRVNKANGSRVVNLRVFAPDQPSTSDPATRARLQVNVDPNNAIAEGHEGNNAAEFFTAVKVGSPQGNYKDLQITMDTQIPTDSAAPAGAIKEGRAFTYLLTVSNTGTDDAFNVVVRDPLPSGVTFVSAHAADIASNFTCQHAGGVVTCTGGYVKGTDSGGGDRVIEIDVLAPHQHNRTLLNQAFVDPDNAIPEGSEVNNAAQKQNVVVSTVDLVAGMSAGTAGPATEGDWQFTVENSGTDLATNVLVVANFSGGTIHLNTAAPGWSCEVFENPVNQVRCVGDVAAGATETFSVHYYKTSDETINSYVIVDPNDTIVESDETDNRADATG